MLRKLHRALAACFGHMTEAGARACVFTMQMVKLLVKTGCVDRFANGNAVRLPVTTNVRGYWKTLILTLILIIPSVSLAFTPPGTSIDNVAAASFTAGGPPVTVNSNTVRVTIRSQSIITLYQYDPVGPGSLSEEVPTQYASSGPPGAGFTASPDPLVPTIGGAPVALDPATPIALNPVDVYHTGEPVFILLDDRDQNLDPAVQETVLVIVTSSTGDQEELVLTETGVNTGIFIGYVQSTGNPVTQYDGLITLGPDSRVSVSYTDPYDGADSSAASTLIDPFGLVFNSVTGEPLDGITVTILDGTGSPATVYGDDGVSIYPNVVTTGGSVTDSSGAVYNFPTGSYRFPLLAPGDYQIVLSVPAAFSVPSLVPVSSLQLLPGAPYALDADASYGNVFTLQAGPPLHVDIPVDPLDSFLVLNKSASVDEAAIGDFVKYTLQLENIDDVAISNDTVINDVLPNGFRYQPGSARLNGLATNEPIISNDGRTLTFEVGILGPGDSVEVNYVTEVSVTTGNGRAINTAIARDRQLGVESNEALASVMIVEDLFNTRSFIVGRVIYGECTDDDNMKPGLPDVKLYMEDGTYVVTDENGQYHFEGVTPGVHVVQVDLVTIPENYEIIDCERNTRFAQTAYSQFIDIKGGSMWRADFYVRHKQPIIDNSTLYLESELNDEEQVKYTVEMSNGKIPVSNYRLMIHLPDGVDYVPGSSLLDAEAIDDPQVMDKVLVYRLGDPMDKWQKRLKFRGKVREKADGDQITTAMVMLNTELQSNLRSEPVTNTLGVQRERVEQKDMVFQAYFNPMGNTLTESSRKALTRAIRALGDAEVTLNQVIGHTDGLTVQKRSAWLFENNRSLSIGRARAVSDFLVNELGVKADKVVIEGRGATEPVASNDTEEGRARNRRAELMVTTSEIVAPGKVEVTVPKSDVRDMELHGQPVYELDEYYNPVPEVEKLHIDMFDEFWIKDAVPGTEWLMPSVDSYPEIPAVNLAVKYNPADKYQMLHNGKPINPLFNFGSIKNRQSTVARVYWQGVHLEPGENRFEFIASSKDGEVTAHLSRTVTYSDVPVRAEIVDEYSRLIADGTRSPVVAVRLYDRNGYLVRPGVVGQYELSNPYISKQEIDALDDNRLAGLDRNTPYYETGAQGIALIRLEPTTETGRLSIRLPMANGQDQELATWLRAEARDWILVGLAEGTVGYNTVTGNMQGLDAADYEERFYEDGRIAFFAKGKVKGDWLLTTAFDSSKGNNGEDNRVHQLIDPDTYYTIYGDGSTQRHEASSAEKIYIKLEREQFYALFGDMDTGLTVTELSKFSRRMTGLKTELESDEFSFTAFAAENLNNFIKDEIQGDGTSGLYRLTGNDIVINSETITIETRDRFRSEIITESRQLKRHIDYNIDYQDGTLYFREPVSSRDSNFNPIFIVVDYEVESPVKGDITAGGRAAVKMMDDRLEVGGSVVHDASFGAEGDLVGVDATLNVSEKTKVRVEAAASDGESAGTGVSGKALLAEVGHEDDDLNARVYARQEDAEFGLGQRSGTESGTRKYGAEGSYRLNEQAVVDALAYHEDNLNTDAERNVTEASLTYGQNSYSLSAGARMARDIDGAGQSQNSDLLLLGATTRLFDNRLRLRANSETAVGSADDSPDYPSRYILGADYLLTPSIDLFAENEWTMGEEQDTEMSRVGVRAKPWQGADVTTSVNREIQENGVRTFSTLGLTQGFRISERWTGDVALDRSKTIREPGATPFNINVPIAQGTNNDDFTAVSAGARYRGDNYTLNNRLETRNAQTEHKVGAVINWERDLIDGVGYAIGTQLFDTDRADGSELFDGDVRFSLGYRPVSSHWITLNRLEFKLDEETGTSGEKDRQRKLINNLVTNYKPDRYNQLSLNYGVKYVLDNFDGDEYSGVTQLLGSEYRHDISDLIDLGVHGHAMHSGNSSSYVYSSGLSVGFSLARNIWLSIGYNFDGFEDSDFSAAGYTARGPYIQFRMKFDQDSAAEISNWLN